VLGDVPAYLVEVHVGDPRVVRVAGGDQDVVDRAGQFGEERVEPVGVVRVERGRTAGADVVGGLLEAVGIATDEDDVGALGAGPTGGLEPDAGAPADDDDGLRVH
jgi:hypothetical protein